MSPAAVRGLLSRPAPDVAPRLLGTVVTSDLDEYAIAALAAASREELEQMRREYEARIQALEQRLVEAEKQLG